MIVIIGAGLAGLAAAQKLKEAGREDFIILEAQDHVGGRVKTATHIGAKWLYGGKKNPIYDWIKSKDLDYMIKSPEEKINFGGKFFTQNGEEVPENLVKRILKSVGQVRRICHMFPLPIQEVTDANDFRKLLAEILYICNKNLTEQEEKILNAVGDWIELCKCFDTFCEDFDDLPASCYFPPFSYRWNSGFSWMNLAERIVDSVGKDKIYLDWPVSHVEYSTGSARVVLNHGMVIKCDHVLITIPLNVLLKPPKNQLIANFINPDLSQLRRDCMDSVSVGQATQIVLEFKSRPWNHDEFRLLWTCDPVDVDLPRWTKDLIGFRSIPGNRKTVIAEIGREGATEVEKCTDAEIGEICRKVMKLNDSDRVIPELVKVRLLRWSTNPYFGYGNSHPSKYRRDKSSTWKPIYVDDDEIDDEVSIPRILFAGEATAGDMCGTAHGAIMSGWREAERLLKFLQPREE